MAFEKNGTIATQEEVAKKMGISDSEVSRLEKNAMNKLQLVMSTPANTHLIAHKPTIKEIDEVFRTLPWCRFIEAPIRNGSRYSSTRQVITRSEWTKSLTEADKLYYIEGEYKIT